MPRAAGLRRGSGNRRRPVPSFSTGLMSPQRVTSHEESPAEPAARQDRTAAATPGDQPGPAPPAADPDALGAVRRGVGGAARPDRPAQVLFVVSAAGSP